jgi:hypothetical protein
LLARFIKERSKFQKSARYKNFMPAEDLALSVYHVTGLPQGAIVAIGRQEITPKQPLRGYAAVSVRSVQKAALRAMKDDIPPRHVDVVGWSGERAARMNAAKVLAAEAEFIQPAELNAE